MSTAQVLQMPAEAVFGGFFTMKEYIAVYVPSTVDVDIPIDNRAMITLVQHELSDIFGGTSAYQVDGTYLSDSGALVAEKTTVVKSFAQEVTGDSAARVVALAERLKALMKQECIGVEYNGSMMFI